MKKVEIFDTPEELSRRAAQLFAEASRRAIGERGHFTAALAGGSTPKGLYKILADENDEFRAGVGWKKVFIFFGDERNVPPNDEQSNYKMAHEVFLSNVPLPRQNIFRIKGELSAKDAAEDYSKTIRRFFKLDDDELPRFDLILLGLGDDAHTASIFPHTSAAENPQDIAAAVNVRKLQTERVTLTAKTINQAREILFLVSGEAKASALKNVLEGEFQPEEFPAQLIKPTDGELIWLTERGAASLLD